MNHGACFGYACAAAILALTGLKPRLEPTTSAAFGARAVRPAYSVLDNANLGRLGLDDLKPWQEALREYLEERCAAKGLH
jgi:dTDP-4-dehydrorhamnose reductase